MSSTLNAVGMDTTTGQQKIAQVGDILTISKITGNGPAPTIAAGSGAGTSPTISISGTDLAGCISLTTGTLPSGSSATIATVTFGTSGAAAPNYVSLTPANAAAAAVSGSGSPLVPKASVAAGSFPVASGITGLVASTAYQWYYHVIW